MRRDNELRERREVMAGTHPLQDAFRRKVRIGANQARFRRGDQVRCPRTLTESGHRFVCAAYLGTAEVPMIVRAVDRLDKIGARAPEPHALFRQNCPGCRQHLRVSQDMDQAG